MRFLSATAWQRLILSQENLRSEFIETKSISGYNLSLLHHFQRWWSRLRHQLLHLLLKHILSCRLLLISTWMSQRLPKSRSAHYNTWPIVFLWTQWPSLPFAIGLSNFGSFLMWCPTAIMKFLSQEVWTVNISVMISSKPCLGPLLRLSSKCKKRHQDLVSVLPSNASRLSEKWSWSTIYYK